MPDTRQVIVAKKLEKLILWEKDGMLVVSGLGMGMEGLKHQGEGGPPLCKVQVPLEEAEGSKDGTNYTRKCKGHEHDGARALTDNPIIKRFFGRLHHLT